MKSTVIHTNYPPQSAEASVTNLSKATTTGFSKPFPGWINRWTILLLGAFFLLPLTLLLLVRQPVYTKIPFSVAGSIGKSGITLTVSSVIAAHNIAGDRVILLTDANGYQSAARYAGYLSAIEPLNIKECRLRIMPVDGKMEEVLANGPHMITGQAILKSTYVSILGKIFYRESQAQ
ncbi:MAG: hypothetical protein J7623_27675 [Chitinophaga sp.]|uniref:hypothetical protein n=1 Tax=Chitinophaga sp. TaxID=1869181 RepID=UPI001B0EA898|nr:hypothetical protein [Chitinophaga sp.]MBO9732453.1 hypothetical protein [Chitinophaga sp.]